MLREISKRSVASLARSGIFDSCSSACAPGGGLYIGVIMATKQCGKCKKVLSITEFYKTNDGEHRYGRQSYCKCCQREHRRLPEIRKKISARNKLYRQTHSRPRSRPLTREQRKAHARAWNLKKNGTLIPVPCEKCGELRVEMHHPDYQKPDKVVWLCRSCHHQLHNTLRKLELSRGGESLCSSLNTL